VLSASLLEEVIAPFDPHLFPTHVQAGTLMHVVLSLADRHYAETLTFSGIRPPLGRLPAETIALELTMNAPAPTERLERFRHYMTLLARMEIGPGNLRHVDASGVVNATLANAHRQWDQFRGTNDAELAAWLRRMLACNLADEFRRIHRQKRDVGRERSLEAELDQTCTRLEDWLVALQTSPSARAVRSEQLMRLAWALGELPEDQRNAVELHHLHGCPISELAELLGRTKPSVAGLLRRGLERLRELLHEGESES
jgi:RNA polymerase sigma-70 factor (ECF subfamily)